MSLNYIGEFHPGQTVISIVHHPPEIEPGAPAVIVSPWRGSLCAVQLPNGEIHRWFASFELAPVNGCSGSGSLAAGNYAVIVSNMGHGTPPHIPIGTVVRIVKCIPQVTFYDLRLHGTDYHRWLAEFELAAPLL